MLPFYFEQPWPYLSLQIMKRTLEFLFLQIHKVDEKHIIFLSMKWLVYINIIPYIFSFSIKKPSFTLLLLYFNNFFFFFLFLITVFILFFLFIRRFFRNINFSFSLLIQEDCWFLLVFFWIRAFWIIGFVFDFHFFLLLRF